MRGPAVHAARAPRPRVLRFLLAGLLLLSLGAGRGLRAEDGARLSVDRELRLRGQTQFSTRQLRRRLGAGTAMDTSRWRVKLDSLALAYAERGHPLLSVEVAELESGPDGLRLSAIELDEGPRLVFGTVSVSDRDGLLLPDIARDLPPGRTATAVSLAEGLDAWLRRLEDEGRPLSRLALRDLQLWPVEGRPDELRLDLFYDLDSAAEWRPVEIRFEGLEQARPLTVSRLARLESGRLHDPRRMKEARRRLLASGWFQEVDGPLLARGPDGPALLLRLKEAPSTRFDGLAGLLPAQGDESHGRISFHLQLDFDDLLGTGRELHLLASRLDGLSQTLKVGYREPFLLGLPLGAGLQLEQRLQDTSWVELGFEASLDWEPWPGLVLGGGLGYKEIGPDSLNGRVLRGVDRSASRLARLTVAVDRRDDPRNPRLGWSAEAGALRQKRRTLEYRGLPPLGGSATLLRRTAALKLWWPLGGRWVLHSGLSAGQLGEGAPDEERIALGGSRGPRGLREDELRVDEHGLLQLELRYLLGPAARAALFGDWLRYRRDDVAGSRHGLGAALVLPVKTGQVELQYAVADGRPWREGLVHVRLITRF